MSTETPDPKQTGGPPGKGPGTGDSRGVLPWLKQKLSRGFGLSCCLGTTALIVIVGLLALELIGAVYFKGRVPFVGLGKEPSGVILVGTPKVYTRERLINARLRQREWLEEQFKLTRFADPKEAERKAFQYLYFHSSKAVDRQLSLEAVLGADGMAEQENGQKQTARGQGNKPTGAENEAATAAEAEIGAVEFGLPTQLQYEVLSAFRHQVEHEWLKTQLDDRHDIEGNTIYQLALDVSLLVPPGEKDDWLNKVAIVHMAAKEPVLENGEAKWKILQNEDLRLYELWLDWREHLEPLVNGAARSRHTSLFGGLEPQGSLEEARLIDFLERSLAADPYALALLELFFKAKPLEEISGGALGLGLATSQDPAAGQRALAKYQAWFQAHDQFRRASEQTARRVGVLRQFCGYPGSGSGRGPSPLHRACLELNALSALPAGPPAGQGEQTASGLGAAAPAGQPIETSGPPEDFSYDFNLAPIGETWWPVLVEINRVCASQSGGAATTADPSQRQLLAELCGSPPEQLRDRLAPLLKLLQARNIAWDRFPGAEARDRLFPFTSSEVVELPLAMKPSAFRTLLV